MSIASEIARLQQAKAALAASITNKGVTVPADATLDDYPALVDSIQGGGSFQYGAEIEFLESTGTQYIDTGISPSFGLSFDCTFENPGPITSEGFGNVFGARVQSNSNEYQLTLYNGGTVGLGYRISVPMSVSTLYRVTWDGVSTLSCNGTNYSVSTKTISCPYNIILFGIYNGNTVGQLQKGKIYACKFGSVRDFIPVRVGQVGYMYDKVSGMLFGNAGSGAFILGPDKT